MIIQLWFLLTSFLTVCARISLITHLENTYFQGGVSTSSYLLPPQTRRVPLRREKSSSTSGGLLAGGLAFHMGPRSIMGSWQVVTQTLNDVTGKKSTETSCMKGCCSLVYKALKQGACRDVIS